jgi:hypothetical protein|tara:strand:+ start:1137 stop:1505 length:369 start_codon:yes stop_codon:yes gene_type:complete
MQYSLFDHATPDTPFANNPEISRIVLQVKRVPSMQTIQKHCWGASCRAGGLSDKDLVSAWKYAFALQAYWRLNRRPVDFHERAHYHMVIQILDERRLAIIEDEMQARGLMDMYELDILLPHH